MPLMVLDFVGFLVLCGGYWVQATESLLLAFCFLLVVSSSRSPVQGLQFPVSGLQFLVCCCRSLLVVIFNELVERCPRLVTDCDK